MLKDLTDRGAAIRVNAEFPQELARLCADAGMKLVHLSSDGVFSGRGEPSDKSSAPDPDDEYGVQKLAGEPAFGLVLRASIIGPERRGFEALLCWFLAQKGTVPGYSDQLSNGVTSVALARAIANVIAQRPLPNGVRHVFTDDVTKQELLIRIARAFGREMNIHRRVHQSHAIGGCARDIPSSSRRAHCLHWTSNSWSCHCSRMNAGAGGNPRRIRTAATA